MAKWKIYLSSTYLDLKEQRTELRSYFETYLRDRFDLTDIMEKMYDKGLFTSFEDDCIDAVHECDIYIVILGNKIGSFPPSKSTDGLQDRTYTEIELDTAIDPNNKKHVYCFRLEEFDENEIDNKTKHREILDKFKGKHIHFFHDIESLKLKVLECLSQYEPKPEPKTTDGLRYKHENYITKIDRISQISTIKRKKAKAKAEKILYFCYFSQKADFAHALNFRLSNLELESKMYELRNQYYVPFDFELSEEEFVEDFVQKVSEQVLKREGKDIVLINDFYERLNRKHSLKNLVIPVKVEHCLHTNESVLPMLARTIQLFADPEYLNILIDKRIIFMINVQYEIAPIADSEINTIVAGLSNTIKGINNLGKLGLVSKADVGTWISENFESNWDDVDKFVEEFFPGNEFKSMNQCMNEAEELINFLNKQKI